MKKLVLFLKWFFGYRGSTKVHPAMAFKYLPSTPGINPQAAGSIAEGKLSGIYHERTCKVCGCTYWSTRKKNPSPVCTTWSCYRDYHTKPYQGDTL